MHTVAWIPFFNRSESAERHAVDVLIAAIAPKHTDLVYTLDPHFEKIPGLTLYRPAKPRAPRR
jgi:predicted nucleic acid-binding protein